MGCDNQIFQLSFKANSLEVEMLAIFSMLWITARQPQTTGISNEILDSIGLRAAFEYERTQKKQSHTIRSHKPPSPNATI
jgi:hypothetical protein